MKLLPFRRDRAAAMAAPTQTVDASVDVGTIRQRFNWEWALDNDAEQDTYWWWARSIRIDPNEVIAEDDEGNLWSVPFTTDGEDTVTFGDPVRVRETFVPVQATEGVAATAVVNRRRQRVLAAGLERPDKPGRDTTAAERPLHEEDDPVRINIAALRDRLGISASELPDDATEEQVNQVLATEADPEGAQPNGNGDEPEAEAADAPGSEEEQPEEQPADEQLPAAASALAPGTVVVDAERLAALEAEAAVRRESERDQVLAAAMQDGRFAPSRLAHYAQAWDADPDGTRHLLTASAAEGGLAPDTVPQHLRGTSTVKADAGLDRVRASMGLKARKED